MKYIIFDLDSTILNNKGELTEYTLEVLNQCRKKGYLLVINTARSKLNSLDIYDKIKPDYSVYFGGGAITDINNEVLYTKPINQQSASILIEDLHINRLFTHISLETISTLYSNDYNYVQSIPHAKYINSSWKIDEPLLKIVLESTFQTTIAKKAQNLDLEYVNYVGSRSSKYLGNKALFALLEDDNPMDYTFGDDLGDLEMIEHAYCGVLLKNANPMHYPKAKYITDFSNDEDGVAIFLEDNILKKQ